MKLHLITIGEPKLAYAKAGWNEYLGRLQRLHQARITHLADKWANDTNKIAETVGKAYLVALVIDGRQVSSQGLADFLEQRAQEGREVCFVIGGPDGLPIEIIERADWRWGLSALTFPHDLAMVIMLETLYRSSTINSGHPYHRA